MKNLVLIFGIIMLPSINLQAQEWFKVTYIFDFKNISSERQFSKYDFEIKEGARTNSYKLEFDNVNQYMFLSYETMGGRQPLFILEKNNRNMIIDLDEYLDNSNVQNSFKKADNPIKIKGKFKKGVFQVFELKIRPDSYNDEIKWQLETESVSL